MPPLGTVTAAAGCASALEVGLGCVIACSVSGKALPCASVRPFRLTVSRPGTIGLLKVTRTTDSESATASMARSAPAPPKRPSSVNMAGLMASLKLKSITRPATSSPRFCSAETSVGALASPLPVPSTAALSTSTSATDLTPEAESVKSAQTLARLPRSTVSVCAPVSKKRSEPVRSKV